MLFVYGAAGFLGLWFVVPYAVRKVDVYRLRKLCQKHRTIALTFDDGPSNSVTSKLLHLFADFRAHATFFALGHKIESCSEACALIAGGGHEFGSHSYRHLNAWEQSPLAVYRDIDQGLSLVRKLNAAPFFRPPHGKITLATLLQVWMNKCRLAWWTIDSSDTWATPKSVEAVLDEIRRQGGGVILLHDHDRSSHPEREAYVLDLTRAILEMARNERFRVCKLSAVYNA